ncbi:MAG: IclR family transcriptional regulator [Burkholderiaceae bacterium]
MPSTRKPASARASAPPAADGEDSPLYVNAIGRAFQVLHAFDGPRREMTLSDIAKAAQIDRSAVQRIVHTLETLGYVTRVPDSKNYRLTSRLLQFSYNYVRTNELIAKALPYLQELNRSFGETTNLQELDGTDIVLVARLLSPHLMNVEIAVGSRLPAFCTASGTAILSRLPESESDAILAASERRPLTPYTELRLDRLRQRIRTAARRGYSLVTNEAMLGDISLAAPVLDHRGWPVAAVNISVPTARWTVEQVESDLANHVQATAMTLSATKFSFFAR